MSVVGGHSWKVYRPAVGVWCARIIIAESRIGCLVAAKVQLVNLDGVTSCLLNVHLEMSLDDTTEVVAAEDLAKGSAGDGQLHIAIYISIIGTTEYQIGLRRRHTAHDQNNVAIDICVLTGTDNLTDCLGTRDFAFLYVKVDIARNVTLLVAGSIDFVNRTTINRGIGVTRAVFTIGVV